MLQAYFFDSFGKVQDHLAGDWPVIFPFFGSEGDYETSSRADVWYEN